MNKAEKKIDESVIERVKKGDLACFDIMYRHYSKRLYSFILQILKNHSDTEEIVQDVFLTLWETREKLNVNNSFDSYLFTITYNKTISLLRKRFTKKKYIQYIMSLQNCNPDYEDSDKNEIEEYADQIYNLAEQLPCRQKQVFKLHQTERLSYKQIAEKLNISVNTVENHMVKAMRFLRQNLRRDIV